MDIIYNGMLLKKEQDRIYEKKQFIAPFWDKESKWEQKIYGILKNGRGNIR